ncbi:DUF2334 domain-containing protein [Bdellovibrio sp. HCB2-146]|uniref:DUF2334 domain-containing protein n=1 Tax=Bdellovibrio sp. HCB2-146 TaxID=3394362 RepID=UPI0039BD1429
MGKTYSVLVQNLLGHFPEYQQIVSPIELYKKGDIENCRASIYIASYFDNRVPQEFYQDYVATKKNVAWLGYKVWNLGTDFEKIFGYRYSGLSHLDYDHLDKNKNPTYFKNIHYKGEVFFKYGGWSKDAPGVYLAPFEQTLLSEIYPNRSKVLATAQHNFTAEKSPYILRSGNHFYIADIPLSFIHEADRYFVFADILFDILGEAPRHDAKHAILRIEDVHALIPLSWLYKVTDLLEEEQVPVNISIIPIFFDPLYNFTRSPFQSFVTMDRHPPFMSYLREIQKRPDAGFIWHGVTHQYSNHKNPHSGSSGDDFEFFDARNNQPLTEDSVSYVLNKLEDGNVVMKAAQVQAPIWLMPHYQASPLDYLIFARVFPWNIGRVIYYNIQARGVPEKEDPRLYMSSTHPQAAALRENAFKNLAVQYTGSPWTGQMFPYEIYGDIYGQRLIPENLGNSQPFINEHVTAPRSKEEIVADAKRNLVLRDAWASFFYHPFLVTSYEEGGRGRFPGDPAELQFIIRELKKLGYKFIDINAFIKNNTVSKRPEPIYKDTL